MAAVSFWPWPWSLYSLCFDGHETKRYLSCCVDALACKLGIIVHNALSARIFHSNHFIKSLQEDCIPEDLKAPGTRDEAGIDHVDVMNFLDLKRAKPIHAEQEKKP